MDIAFEPGVYVVAVSGGVDSMVLLDVMRQYPGVKVVVAHFDHGIRPDAVYDRMLVQDIAKKHGLPFVFHEGRLGEEASEATARKARYDFLHNVKETSGAKAIVTAHHQDDLMETAVMNLIRGTHRRGLTALRSTETVRRPLLLKTKAELIAYAREQGLKWREDRTNQDVRYFRNHIRHNVMPRFSEDERKRLYKLIMDMHQLNDEIDARCTNHLHVRLDNGRLNRYWFLHLPHSVAREVMAAWLRRHDVRNIDKPLLERLVVACKTLAAGQSADVDKNYYLTVMGSDLALMHRDR